MRQLTPLVAAVALLIAAPAMAQQPSTTSTPNASTSVLTTPPADSMTVTAYYKQNVYDNNNNKIGQIVDVLVGKDGKINAFVIGAGGFLGMGKHDVMVPFSAVKMVKDADRTANANDRNASDRNANDRNANDRNNNRNANNDRNRNDRSARSDRNDYRLVMDTSKDALKNAPGVKYDRTAMTWIADDSNNNRDSTTGRKSNSNR